MKNLFLIFISNLLFLNFLFAQKNNDFIVPKAISFETQFLIRGEQGDRGGYGVNVLIGTVHRSDIASRFRFVPTVEYGVLSLLDKNEVRQSNSYASVNLAIQYDIVRIKNYSIPFNAGLVFDTSFKKDEIAIFNPAIRFGFSSRIESPRSRNAFEFLSMGFTVSTNINEDGAGVGALYMSLIKVEHKF